MTSQSVFGSTIPKFVGILLVLFLVLSTSQSLSIPGSLFPDLLTTKLDAQLEPSSDVAISIDGGSQVQMPDESKKRLCPDGSAFHNETSSCQSLLEQGPCGDLQIFYPLSKDSEYGDCACISDSDGCNKYRMVLPSPDSKQCFWAYSKGPCQSGEWYVLNLKTMKPECQKNPCCPPSSTMKKIDSVIVRDPPAKNDLFTFILNGTCFKTYTRGFCSESQYVHFLGTNDPYPKCRGAEEGPPLCMFGVAPVVGMPCEPGYKQVGDECVLANPEFE